MYDIGLKNTIFDEKHYEKMGMSVWLYAWLVDKVTKEKDGLGFVLGGTPICYAKVGTWLSERTYKRHISTLRKYGYIITQKTARGLIFYITKTKKRHAINGTSDMPQVAQQGTKSGTSKRHTIDNNRIDNVLRSGSKNREVGKMF